MVVNIHTGQEDQGRENPAKQIWTGLGPNFDAINKTCLSKLISSLNSGASKPENQRRKIYYFRLNPTKIKIYHFLVTAWFLAISKMAVALAQFAKWGKGLSFEDGL